MSVPTFPSALIGMKTDADVFLRLVVGAEGIVEDVEWVGYDLHYSSIRIFELNPNYGEDIIRAMKVWRVTRGDGGIERSSTVDVTLRFRVDGSGPEACHQYNFCPEKVELVQRESSLTMTITSRVVEFHD